MGGTAGGVDADPERAERRLLASWGDAGVVVYQAFKPAIAEAAIRLGTFGRGFNVGRMTWIKPSFGWMLYRSNYARAHRQERILRITLTHGGFTSVLAQAIPTSFDPALFASEKAWRAALARSEVRYQWDPDRDLRLRRLGGRALQLGIRGSVVRRYVADWIVSIEDVTGLAHAIWTVISTGGQGLPPVPIERPYPISPQIRAVLGMLAEPALDGDLSGDRSAALG